MTTKQTTIDLAQQAGFTNETYYDEVMCSTKLTGNLSAAIEHVETFRALCEAPHLSRIAELEAGAQSHVENVAAMTRTNFALAGQVNDLAMLTRRLLHALNHVSPGNPIAAKAANYLTDNGLQGGPVSALRDEAQQPSAPSLTDSVYVLPAQLREVRKQGSATVTLFSTGGSDFATLYTYPPAQRDAVEQTALDVTNFGNFEKLTHALEIIGTGDAENPQVVAQNALVNIGFWEAAALASKQGAVVAPEVVGYAIYSCGSGVIKLHDVRKIEPEWKSEDGGLGDYWAGNEALGVITPAAPVAPVEREAFASVGPSLLREPISVTNPLPPGCYCPPDRCGAPVIMGRQTPCRRTTPTPAGMGKDAGNG